MPSRGMGALAGEEEEEVFEDVTLRSCLASSGSVAMVAVVVVYGT